MRAKYARANSSNEVTPDHTASTKSSASAAGVLEPEPGIVDPSLAGAGEETLQRMGLGAPDVPAAVSALRARGVEFVESPGLHTEDRGALTKTWLGGVMFELVQDKR